MATNRARLCGPGLTRDSIYHQLELSNRGIPIWKLVFCPPILADAALLGLSAQGVQILKRIGRDGTPVLDPNGHEIYDIWDIIGQSFYPHTIDFYMEVNHKGLSRKIPKTAQLDLLGPWSVHFVLHEKALADLNSANGTNARKLWLDADQHGTHCIRHIPDHDRPAGPWIYGPEGLFCSKLWWHVTSEKESKGGIRHGVGYDFQVFPHPDDVQLDFQLARFMWFPMGSLVFTYDEEGKMSEANQEALSKVNLDIKVETVDVDDIAEE